MVDGTWSGFTPDKVCTLASTTAFTLPLERVCPIHLLTYSTHWRSLSFRKSRLVVVACVGVGGLFEADDLRVWTGLGHELVVRRADVDGDLDVGLVS